MHQQRCHHRLRLRPLLLLSRQRLHQNQLLQQRLLQLQLQLQKFHQ
jgi:hypothetical protein